MFGRKLSDPLSDARATVERLKKEAQEASRAAGAAKAHYNDALQRYVAGGLEGEEPPLQKLKETEARLDSLRRMLVVASDHLARLTREADDAARDAAIKASGSRVAQLKEMVESKLVDFETAINTVRGIESELFDILYNNQTGMKQDFADHVAKKDAIWLRFRLVKRLIAIAEKGECRVDARFEIDGEWHYGELETRFYRRAASTGA